MVTIRPIGGLCNYLKVIFSYYEYARKNNLKLNVIWEKTNACPGYFWDYFEPIPGIRFIGKKDAKIDYTGCEVHEHHRPKYDKLKLKPHMKKIIFDKINKLNKNYISVHIRRTDHINLAKHNKCFTTDKEFINFLNKSDKNIYIATDNTKTYEKFKKKYQKRIKLKYHKTNVKKMRQTSLRDAIVDIYMCIYSDDFKGSGHSSFSTFIGIVRNHDWAGGADWREREKFLKSMESALKKEAEPTPDPILAFKSEPDPEPEPNLDPESESKLKSASD